MIPSALNSLRVRLIAIAFAWTSIALLAGFLGLSSIFRAQVEQEFDDELIVHSEELERITRFNRQGLSTTQLPFSDPRYDDPDSGFYWEVSGPDGVRFSSGSLGGGAIGPLPQDSDSPHSLRIVEAPGPTGPMIAIARFGAQDEGGLRFAVATDTRHVEAAIREFDGVLALALGGLGAIMLFASLGLVTFGLSPFSKLAGSMRNVRSGVSLAVEGRFPIEVQPLVNELNSLIKGHRETLQRARAQAGNLAHALKSPLAIVSDEAFQLADRDETAAAATISEQCRVMQLHIDHHIARTRAQVVSGIPGTQSSVADVIDNVARALARLHIKKSIVVDMNVDPQIRAAMDGQDLSELVANLVDNAYKFARSHIAISAAAVDSQLIVLRVEDDGPGLPPEARQLVFSPGVRLDESRPGTGLGLSIVRELLELYSGGIDLGVSRMGGLEATVTLKRHL